ncbi:MAG TPA: SMEK domain-containing protein [Pyrinomonadaceae bacterium]|nr:SMEK domain-containing protein [Pyrinomonadaceae bacterium]
MNLQKSIDRIIELFLIFRREIDAHNRVGLFDKNRLAEDVLVPILRDVFESPFLRNLNHEQNNYPGLDLGDDQSMLAFQITSESSIEKIKDTLRIFVEQKHYLRYKTVYVYVLTQKQKKYGKKALKTILNGHLQFDPDEHVIDSWSLTRRIEKLDYQIVRRIEETLEVHFSNPNKYFVRPQTPTKTENLVLNLLPITLPTDLYIARIVRDRREIIEDSWHRDFKIPLNSSERLVIWAALEQEGVNASSDWVVRSGEIITFQNLRDEDSSLAHLVDSSSVDPIPVNTYVRGDDGHPNVDRLNTVKELLRNTLRVQTSHRGIVWQHEEELFIFIDPDGGTIRKEAWSGGTKAGRVVYHQVRDKTDPLKIWFHEHLAFRVGFDLYESQWYVSIKPDWFCSWNGYNKSNYQHKNRISFLKKKTHNSDVLIALRFIVEILRKDQNEALLNKGSGPRISLGEPVALEGALLIPDAEWLQQEEKKKREGLKRIFEGKEDTPLLENQ